MKYFYLLAAFLFLPACISAQISTDSSNVPKVEILQNKWRFETRNRELETDPFRRIEQHNQANPNQVEFIRDSQIREQQGKPQESLPTPSKPLKINSSGFYSFYSYELKIKNTGDKAIQKVVWDYVSIDPDTKLEIGRRHLASFLNGNKIKPGKTRNLIARLELPPTGTINAAKVGVKFIEQIDILAIEYADGSVWKAAVK